MKKLLLLPILFTQITFAGVKTVHDGNFEEEVIKSPIPVIVKTFTTWCGACQDMAPHFRTASNQVKSHKFVELNTVNNPKTRDKHGIEYVPTTVIFVGGKEVFRHTGVLNSTQISNLAKQYTQ